MHSARAVRNFGQWSWARQFDPTCQRRAIASNKKGDPKAAFPQPLRIETYSAAGSAAAAASAAALASAASCAAFSAASA